MDTAQEPARGRAYVPVVVVFLILLLYTTALVAASIPAGTYAFFSGSLSGKYNYASLFHPYFWVGPVVVALSDRVSAGGEFAFLTGIYLVFLAYGVSQKARPWNAIRKSLREGIGAVSSSPFFVMVISIGFLVFTASILDGLITGVGVPIGSISGDPLGVFLGFTISPLVEEVGFRVAIIGTVALILSIGRPWRNALGALWRPSKAVDGLAVGSGASIIIWAVTGVSSLTFGACHVACGGAGWYIGKLPEAAYGGLVLGYLYVRYGFHVAVIAHWGVDYFGSAFAFFGQAVYGIPWNSGAGEYFAQYLVDTDLLFLFGLASFLLVAYLGIRKIFGRGKPTEDDPLIKPPSLGRSP
jgi:hypothetical protein